MPPTLNNTSPIDPSHSDNETWLKNLQGNILTGHGRDHTVHLFLRLLSDVASAKAVITQLANHVTSAHKQEVERQQFKDYRIPGGMFGNLFLSAHGYRKLGFTDEELTGAFTEADGQPRRTDSNFLDGMAKHAEADLGDPSPSQWDKGFDTDDIDAMLLLADDDEGHLLREARRIIDSLDSKCEIARIERGTALRNEDGEGIEHFGYVDGRSQPLFLTTDFTELQPDGSIGPHTKEKDGGRTDIWNPFEPLSLVLLPDPLAKDNDSLGSYFVFRKLEQNVRDFTIAEQQLADKLGLRDEERERAGAMVVGRFRDGTPLVLSQTDGFIPAKENNFRYDQNGPDDGKERGDLDGLKCPFHAHIRKTNPRGDIGTQFGAPESAERSHRIARRGIPFGDRNRHPSTFQALDDLPSKDVGLLFMCFQASIRNQFAFMQRGWANSQTFIKDGVNPDTRGVLHPMTGLDPIIGQLDRDDPTGPVATQSDQTWRPEYGSREPEKPAFFGNFIRMRGGEFFFASSISFLKNLNS